MLWDSTMSWIINHGYGENVVISGFFQLLISSRIYGFNLYVNYIYPSNNTFTGIILRFDLMLLKERVVEKTEEIFIVKQPYPIRTNFDLQRISRYVQTGCTHVNKWIVTDNHHFSYYFYFFAFWYYFPHILLLFTDD